MTACRDPPPPIRQDLQHQHPGHAGITHDRDHGTDVTFSVLPTDARWTPGVIANAVRHYPIPVSVNRHRTWAEALRLYDVTIARMAAAV